MKLTDAFYSFSLILLVCYGYSGVIFFFYVLHDRDSRVVLLPNRLFNHMNVENRWIHVRHATASSEISNQFSELTFTTAACEEIAKMFLWAGDLNKCRLVEVFSRGIQIIK